MLIIVLEFCVMMKLHRPPHGPTAHRWTSNPSESEFLAQQLETLRHNGTITNEAFLDAGAVQERF